MGRSKSIQRRLAEQQFKGDRMPTTTTQFTGFCAIDKKNPAAYVAAQSTDQGKTITWKLICAGHRQGWNDGGDWAAPVLMLEPVAGVIRSQRDIDRVIGWAAGVDDSHYPGMMYEQGLMDMWNWLTEHECSAPDDGVDEGLDWLREGHQ